MLFSTRVTVPLLALVAVGAGAYGLYLEYRVQNDVTSTLAEQGMRTVPAASLAPVTTPPAVPSTAASPHALARVEGTRMAPHTASPFAPSTPTPQPSPTATSESSAVEHGIEFIDLSDSVPAGEQFRVQWRVTGPEGATGENTKLTVVYKVNAQEGNSSSSVNSNTSTSFGSFAVPETFSSTFTFGQQPGPVVITASATVDGQEVKVERTVTLTR